MNSSRRRFLQGVGVGGLVIAAPRLLLATEASGDLSAYPGIVVADATQVPPTNATGKKKAVTEDNIEGPFYRAGAPHRAKLTPPHEPGTVLLVSGHVYGFDTQKPLANAVLDVWQANEKGRYDNDDPNAQPEPGVYLLRARMVTDENGYYEYETIHPGAYKESPLQWRPAHIHYMVSHINYETLTTQMYFDGDKHNKKDRFIKKSLIMPVSTLKSHGKSYEAVTFDIVLARRQVKATLD